MSDALALTVNGQSLRLDVAPDTPLLYVLRNDLQLNGPKFGCGLGECGACTVLMDGVATRSCITPVEAAVGRRVVTLEGLGDAAHPHPLQQAFIDEQAAQCGYCINGMVMTAKALLDRNRTPATARSARNWPTTCVAAAPMWRFSRPCGVPPRA